MNLNEIIRQAIFEFNRVPGELIGPLADKIEQSMTKNLDLMVQELYYDFVKNFQPAFEQKTYFMAYLFGEVLRDKDGNARIFLQRELAIDAINENNKHAWRPSTHDMPLDSYIVETKR